MKKSKGIISLILVAAVMVFLGVTTIHGLDSKGMGAARNITLGLDLEGGVSITYQVKGDTPSQEDMDDTVYKMQRRVEQYSTEAQAYQEGDNRISIEIPGVEDANTILEELGQPGSLYFIRHYDSEGNENYTLGSDGVYVLNKSIEEPQEDLRWRRLLREHISPQLREPLSMPWISGLTTREPRLLQRRQRKPIIMDKIRSRSTMTET